MTNDEAPEDDNEDRSTALAMVATSSQRLPDVAAINKACGVQGSLFSRLLSKFGKRKEEEEQWDEGVLMLDFDTARVFVSLMPIPIPWSELEGPCATAWWWPEATEAMRKHQYHFLVVVKAVDWNEVEQRMLLADVIQGIVKSTDAIGVYWGDATLVMQPSIYSSVVKKATVDDVPMMLFTDVRVEQISEGVYRCFTTGMESLGFHEIEVDQTTMEPDVLMEFILDIAKYIVDNYLEIPDGNTFGRDAHQQFTARYRPSMFDRGIVMKLDMSGAPLMD